jgi:2-methylcitrate dehydratase PrpD
MDNKEPKTRKEKKKNKDKRNKELNGKYSSKHVRIMQEMASKRLQQLNKSIDTT